MSTSGSYMWKGRLEENGMNHIVGLFDLKMLQEPRSRAEMTLCGRRPKDKGPALPAAVGGVGCKGCKNEYRKRVGRDWREPPLPPLPGMPVGAP